MENINMLMGQKVLSDSEDAQEKDLDQKLLRTLKKKEKK